MHKERTRAIYIIYRFMHKLTFSQAIQLHALSCMQNTVNGTPSIRAGSTSRPPPRWGRAEAREKNERATRTRPREPDERHELKARGGGGGIYVYIYIYI